MPGPQLDRIDRLLLGLDRRLRAAAPPAADATRPNPATQTPEDTLDERERRHAAGLMRVNHAGEVAAQALYRGQAATARRDATREHLLAAAAEENDHLQWCEQRLRELGDAPSRLSPVWYAGSWLIGAAAGTVGDRWSLGFVAETERQVVEHLESHLEALPEGDHRSRRIVERMRDDEARHGQDATDAGGRELPGSVRTAMRRVARLMTAGAYRF